MTLKFPTTSLLIMKIVGSKRHITEFGKTWQQMAHKYMHQSSPPTGLLTFRRFQKYHPTASYQIFLELNTRLVPTTISSNTKQWLSLYWGFASCFGPSSFPQSPSYWKLVAHVPYSSTSSWHSWDGFQVRLSLIHYLTNIYHYGFV